MHVAVAAALIAHVIKSIFRCLPHIDFRGLSWRKFEGSQLRLRFDLVAELMLLIHGAMGLEPIAACASRISTAQCPRCDPIEDISDYDGGNCVCSRAGMGPALSFIYNLDLPSSGGLGGAAPHAPAAPAPASELPCHRRGY